MFRKRSTSPAPDSPGGRTRESSGFSRFPRTAKGEFCDAAWSQVTLCLDHFSVLGKWQLPNHKLIIAVGSHLCLVNQGGPRRSAAGGAGLRQCQVGTGRGAGESTSSTPQAENTFWTLGWCILAAEMVRVAGGSGKGEPTEGDDGLNTSRFINVQTTTLLRTDGKMT